MIIGELYLIMHSGGVGLEPKFIYIFIDSFLQKQINGQNVFVKSISVDDLNLIINE